MEVGLGSIGVGGKQILKSNGRNKIGDMIRTLIITSVLGHDKNFKCMEIHQRVSIWEQNIWMDT